MARLNGIAPQTSSANHSGAEAGSVALGATVEEVDRALDGGGDEPLQLRRLDEPGGRVERQRRAGMQRLVRRRPAHLHRMRVNDERRRSVEQRLALEFFTVGREVGSEGLDLAAFADPGVPLVATRPLGEERREEHQAQEIGRRRAVSFDCLAMLPPHRIRIRETVRDVEPPEVVGEVELAGGVVAQHPLADR